MNDIIFKVGSRYLAKDSTTGCPYLVISAMQARAFNTTEDAWFWYKSCGVNYPEARLVRRVITIEEIKDK